MGFTGGGGGVNRANCAIVSFSTNVVSGKKKKGQYSVAKIRSQCCSPGNTLSLPRKLNLRVKCHMFCDSNDY